jgi:succinate dehydrogenase / fumarate reductase cytochrome b subunit
MTRSDQYGESLAEQRPLSPHLSIFKPWLTMMMSIAHRITGAALYVGFILLALFFAGLALGPGAFDAVSWLVDSFVGRILVFLFSWAFFHHLLGGVRHALWDHVLYLDANGREFLAQATLAGGVALTVLLWIVSMLAS